MQQLPPCGPAKAQYSNPKDSKPKRADAKDFTLSPDNARRGDSLSTFSAALEQDL